ncbi:hypothetical protein SSX86_032498 [Deinandra increscens subsp. villosa]|uniref:RING-type domain-containing protein n=1 Tax=Deinandra increscens subsp. villosa TaxID=3103831 RepID=A0AAP0GH88_9ASTR
MAVETAHLTLFPPQIPPSNRIMMMIGAVDKHSDGNAGLGYRTIYPPLSGTSTVETLLPMYSSGFTNLDPAKPDTELTYTLPVSRKRSRDFSSVCTFSGEPHSNWKVWNPIDRSASFTFLGDDLSSQIRQQQFEIDQFVARHTEKVRSEIEAKRRRNSMKLIASIEEGITQRLRTKEDEIANMTKLNWALEDKIKSLCIENQIWRELAQTNEATANALRGNLKQILDQVVHGELTDDAESCCESNNGNEQAIGEHDCGNSNYVKRRLCKRCGEGESCVLLLPCRHLCLCTVCVSSIDICPICKSAKTISVHVRMS